MIIDGLQFSAPKREIFEQMREGGVTAVHTTIVYHANARETLSAIARWQQLFVEHDDLIVQAFSAEDIANAHKNNKTAIILGFQNPSPIEDELGLVTVFHQLGVRIMQLSYNNQSLLCSGCFESDDTGLTRFGREVVREMNRVGMVIDMSHSGERSTLEAIEVSDRPIIISHANPSFWHKSPRSKSDTVLRELANSGGMLGFSLYPHHLRAGSNCTLQAFCEMVARTADLIGVDHLGIGSDLCQDQPPSELAWMRYGRWTHEQAPVEWPQPLSWFSTNRDFTNIVNGLTAIGFDETDTGKIMGLNWLTFYREAFCPELPT